MQHDRIVKHIIIPALAPAAFLSVAMLPVDLLGCRTRGLIAAVIALAGGVLGIVAAVKALQGKVRADAASPYWMLSALILAVPALLIVLKVV